MVSQLFDDAIVSATELKKNQKLWFDKAYKTPVSITSSKGRNFVLINRETMSSIYKTKEIGERLIKYWYELKQETETGKFKSEVFPWAANLSKEERNEFYEELVNCFVGSPDLKNTDSIQVVIDEWQATAEALTNENFMEVMNTKSSDRSFVKLD